MRKLATAAAVSLVLASGGAKALILGEIEMRSSLNQPMKAEILLSSVADGELEGMIVKLASPEVFSRAGIDRSAALQELRFSVSQGFSGQPVILVTSTRPVVEPFLNFLLEVDWTSGRMVREYTVLLDPPVFMSPNTNRSTTSDTPVITQAPSEESALVPLEIDRSTGIDAVGTEIDLDQIFDEASVVVQGGATEVADDLIISGDDAAVGTPIDMGEIVSLDEAELLPQVGPEVGTVIDTNVVTLTDSEVISLDDIGISDDAALNQNAGWDVQVMGSGNEVGNDIGATVGVSNTTTSGNLTPFTGEVVSLDDLGESSFTGGTVGEVRVAKNDTLWEIANRNKVAGMSTQQMMLALLDANEQAFIKGNINLVKAGAILRIPTANDGNLLSQGEAIAQVRQQEILWREYRDNLRGSRAPTALASNTGINAETANDTAANKVEKTAASVRASAEDILSQARNELRIVADNESTSTVASATADETENASESAQLGGINQKLQLAREELSASRLEGEELADKGAELDSMTENMDQLVSLQQDQLAQLQAQLADARKNQTIADAAKDAAKDATTAATDIGTGVLDTAKGNLNQVELIEDSTETAAITANATTDSVQAAAPTPAAGIPWYQSLLSDPRKAIIAGLGALGALLLGWILLRKRKRPDDAEEELLDQVQFVEDEDADEFGPVADADSTSAFGKVAAGGAAVAGAAGLAAAGESNEEAEQTISLDSDNADLADETTSKDDTVSEAEVYLAYGLHGQAEDLLTKAVDKNPDNTDYHLKLLQTYHAQGKSAEFDEAAKNYHSKFGGNDSPSWDRIAEMGREISGSNELFLGDNTPVANVGAGSSGGPTLDSHDFSTDEGSVQSQIREFSSDESEVNDMGVDETALMDQSIDPGFAFDESDLEATGDFTQLSNEIQGEKAANEASSGIADIGANLGANSGDTAKGAAAGIAAGAAGIAGSIGLGRDDAKAADAETVGAKTADDGMLEFDTSDLESSVSDASEGIQGSIGGKAADLTTDLDALAGDLQLDSTQMLDSGMDLTQDLEIPDLTSNIDLTADASAALGNVDEMDTMMDLAKAYIDMGDNDSASSALGEIVKSGNPVQKTEAENLLKKIS